MVRRSWPPGPWRPQDGQRSPRCRLPRPLQGTLRALCRTSPPVPFATPSDGPSRSRSLRAVPSNTYAGGGARRQPVTGPSRRCVSRWLRPTGRATPGDRLGLLPSGSVRPVARFGLPPAGSVRPVAQLGFRRGPCASRSSSSWNRTGESRWGVSTRPGRVSRNISPSSPMRRRGNRFTGGRSRRPRPHEG